MTQHLGNPTMAASPDHLAHLYVDIAHRAALSYSRAGILITVAAALGGVAFGRVVSGVIDRPKAFHPNGFCFLLEVVAAAALLWAAR